MRLNTSLEKYSSWIPWVVAALCLLECLGFMLYHHATTGWWGFYMPDTQSYIMDGFSLRPPFYPLFLKACGMKVNTDVPTMMVVTLVPVAIYVLSVAAFVRMAITTGGWLGLCLGLLYAFYPSFDILPLELGTESFSVSFVVLAVYLFWRMSYNPSVWLWGAFTAMMLLLLAVKPAFLFVPVSVFIVGVFVGFMREKAPLRIFSRRLVITGVFGIVCVLGYSFGVYQKWGVFTPSTVSLRNDYYEARLSGVLEAECCPDTGLRGAIQQKLDARPAIEDIDGLTWVEVIDLTNEYDLLSLQTAIDASKKKHPDQWNDYFLHKLCNGLSESLVYPGTDRGEFAEYEFRAATGRFLVGIGITWWIPLIVAVAMLSILIGRFVAYMRNRSESQRRCMDVRTWSFAAFLTLMLLGNIVVVVFGAPYDFSRLLVPVLPVFLLLCAQLPGLKCSVNK